MDRKFKRISTKELHELSCRLLSTVDVPKEDSIIIADSIVFSHVIGKGTHGVGRIPLYLNKIRSGKFNNETGKKRIVDFKAMAILDAENGFGQVAGVSAVSVALEKASEFGVSVVGVRNSNNFGTAAFLLDRIVKEGMVGIIFSNSGPAISMPGASFPLFGTNPIGFAFPHDGVEHPVVVDMATSVAARGKIRQAAKLGLNIPFDWALDSFGKPTDDPLKALDGAMLPIGGYKGFALAMVVDILSGLLMGARYAGEVSPLGKMDDFSGYGHFFCCIDPRRLISEELWSEGISKIKKKIRESATGSELYCPGERSYSGLMSSSEEVEISVKVLDSLYEELNNRS
jgi:L-2-hydroxycarboxylate dehydrogenase (NAD+)